MVEYLLSTCNALGTDLSITKSVMMMKKKMMTRMRIELGVGIMVMMGLSMMMVKNVMEMCMT